MSIKVEASDIHVECASLQIHSASIDYQLNQVFSGACPRLAHPNRHHLLHLCTRLDLEQQPLSNDQILSSCRTELHGSSFLVLQVRPDSQHIPFSSSSVLYPFAQAWRATLGFKPRDFFVTTKYNKKGDRNAANDQAAAVPFNIPLTATDLSLWRATMTRQLLSFQRGEKSHLPPVLIASFLGSIVNRMVESAEGMETYNADLSNLCGSYGKLVKCYCRAASCCDDYAEVLRACGIYDSLELGPGDATIEWFKGYSLLKLGRFVEAMPLLDESLSKRWFSPTTLPASFPVEQSIVSCCLALQESIRLPPLLKFPRTPHLFHPSGSTAITDDDEVLEPSARLPQCFRTSSVVLQEKIDGSNLGLTLCLDGTDILAHNRSHYLQPRTKSEHPQYKPLQSWIDQHRSVLLRVLERPSRWVLFGEWVVARHSVPYQRLPGYFIAFDLYDIAAQQYTSQATLAKYLAGTNIPMAPSLTVRLTDNNWKRELLDVLSEEASHFRSDGGPMEGVVLRVEDEDAGYLIHRSKLVRPDFAPGSAGWSKHSIERQLVDSDFAAEYLAGNYGTTGQ